MKQKGITLSKEAIECLFHSESFLTRLNAAARGTRTRGLEYGFSVYRTIDNGYLCYSPVLRGTTDSVNFVGDPALKEMEDACDDRRLHLVLDLHFHPSSNRPVPSFSDLQLLEESVYGLNDRPIATIGTVDKRGRGYLLHLQRQFRGGTIDRHSHFLTELDGRCHLAGRTANMDQIASAINTPGYVACDYTAFESRSANQPAQLHKLPSFERFSY